MVDDLVPFVERQFKYLSGFNGRAYIRQVRRWLYTLSSEPRLSPLLADMEREAERLVLRYLEQDSACVAHLCEIRDGLVQREPLSDDSGAPKPPEEQMDREYKLTFAYFNEIVAEEPRPIAPLVVEDSSRTAELLPILTGKLERLLYTQREEHGSLIRERTERNDLIPLYMSVMTMHDQHQHQHNTFLDEMLTDAGFYLINLRVILSYLNPDPREIKTPEDLAARWDAHQFSMVDEADGIRRELYSASGGRDWPAWAREDLPGGIAPGKAEKLAATLQSHVSRIHEDLVRRIGTRRSLLAHLHRFKERCEWHDRDRLRDLAKNSQRLNGAKSKRRSEEVLTAELARWLFDQGFSPLTKPLAGGLQPDLLDPSRLYVEAKHYRDGTKARHNIVQGAKELYDAVLRLKGTKYEVTEALYVVFRESGPQYKLPEIVQGDGWVTLPIVIDIAPLAESGSRQKHQPIAISAEELGPRMANAGQARRAGSTNSSGSRRKTSRQP